MAEGSKGALLGEKAASHPVHQSSPTTDTPSWVQTFLLAMEMQTRTLSQMKDELCSQRQGSPYRVDNNQQTLPNEFNSNDITPLGMKIRKHPFKPEEIGLFDPADPSTSHRRFVTSIENLSRTYGTGLVLPTVPRCLRGSASEWYHSLNEDVKVILESSVDMWRKLLTRRYDMNPVRRTAKIQRMRYDGKTSIEEYIDKFLILLSEANIVDEAEQAGYIYGSFPQSYQLAITLPTNQPNAVEFLRDQLLHKHDILKYQWQKRPNSFPTRAYSQNTSMTSFSSVPSNSHPQTSSYSSTNSMSNYKPITGKPSRACYICQNPDHYAYQCPNRGKMQKSYFMDVENPDDSAYAVEQWNYFMTHNSDEGEDTNINSSQINTESFFITPKGTHICQTCQETFQSRNSLFYHLRNTGHIKKVSLISPSNLIPTDISMGFSRIFSFLELQAQPTKEGPCLWICLDTGCGISLISRAFQLKYFSTIEKTSVHPLSIRGIGGKTQRTSEIIKISLFFPTTDKRLAEITAQLYILDDLSCGILLGTDVIVTQGIIIDPEQLRIQIRHCDDVICSLRILPRGQVPSSQIVEVLQVTPTIWEEIDDDIFLLPKTNELDINTMDDISSSQILQISKLLIEEFGDIFRNELGIAKQEKHELLRIPILPENLSKIYSKGLYKVPPRDRQAIDDVFDKNRTRGVMSLATPPNPVGWPVFVAWKKDKPRPVIDLHGLNKYTIPDAYPLPKTTDILSLAKGKHWLSSFDLTQFFYQFAIHPDDVWKTAVITHRGQEVFKVVQMGFINSVPHTQRYMEQRFGEFHHFFRSYVDDGLIFNNTFDDHLSHLRQFLTRVRECNLTLSLPKAHIGYHELEHLGYRINGLGLTTTKDKTAAIREMYFPSTLKDLEFFIGFIAYYRHLIEHFASIAKPLMDLKASLLKFAPFSNPSRARFVSHYLIIPTAQQMATFLQLQKILCSKPFIFHPDFDTKPVIFFLFIDASRYAFAAALHQVNSLTASRKDQHPVLFLSRVTTPAESRYWPTELELANIVWALRKLRLYLDQADHFVIFTDHLPNLGIIKATTPNSAKSSNLRLHHWSLFLSQYPQLECCHIPGSQHVNADALSRLAHLRQQSIDTFAIEMITLADDFKLRLQQGYQTDISFKTIYTDLVKDVTDDTLLQITKSTGSGVFTLQDGLLFFADTDKHQRLCIPRSCQQEILELAHDRNAHRGIHETYNRVRQQFYFSNLRQQVITYVSHCPQCELNKPTHHLPYGPLQPIRIPSRPFDVLSIDFIGVLPTTGHGFDFLMTVTDKFSKAIKLLPGLITDSAVIWAKRFFDMVYADWGLPLAILSDRDVRFTSTFWSSLFNLLGTKLLMTTAYHPAADGQAERTNQTVEIALRFYTNLYQNDWDEYLPIIQVVINSSTSHSTKDSPSALLYGQSIRTLEKINLAPTTPPSTFELLSNFEMRRFDAIDAMRLAQHYMIKSSSSQPLKFQVGDFVYLNLRRNAYQISGISSSKLAQQRIGPFRVLECISQLAYRLDLPITMKIHPIISIAHLEPSTMGQDLFHRLASISPFPTLGLQERDIDSLLAIKRIRRQDWYLIRWSNTGPENDSWEPGFNLYDCDDLIKRLKDPTFQLPFNSSKHPRAIPTTLSTKGRPPKITISTRQWEERHNLK